MNEKIFQEFLNPSGGDCPDQVKTNLNLERNDNICVRCQKEDVLIEINSYLVCTECGWTSNEPEVYYSPYTENTYSPQQYAAQYNKVTNCKQQLRNLSITDIYAVFTPEQITDIVSHLPEIPNIQIKEIEKCMKVRGIKLYKYSHLIYQHIKGLPVNRFTTEELQGCEHILDIVLKHYDQARSIAAPKRKIFLGRKFVRFPSLTISCSQLIYFE